MNEHAKAAEIHSLAKQQSKALKEAIYFPMTLEESNQFNDRANLIDKLHRELVKCQSAE